MSAYEDLLSAFRKLDVVGLKTDHLPKRESDSLWGQLMSAPFSMNWNEAYALKNWVLGQDPNTHPSSASHGSELDTTINRRVCALPPDRASPALIELLSRTGLCKCWNDPARFRLHGVENTLLRNKERRNLQFYDREHSMRSFTDHVIKSKQVKDKMPIICIPGGAGMGKSELASRIVENCDEIFAVAGKRNWLAVATTFNFESQCSPIELQHFKAAQPLKYIELMVSLRLLYIWLVDKDVTPEFEDFVAQVLAFDLRGKTPAFSLRAVVALIAHLSQKDRVVVVIDELMRAMCDLDRETQCGMISLLAGHQHQDMVLVFSSVRENPFQNWDKIVSGRPLETIPLPRLSGENSKLLMWDIGGLTIREDGPSACWTACGDTRYKNELLDLLALWTAGIPRLCEMAGVTIAWANSRLATDILRDLCGAYLKKYDKPLPRQCVVMSLLGVKLPPNISCIILDSRGGQEDVENVIASGLMCRNDGDVLYMCPLALKLFCEQIFPPVQPGDIAQASSSSSSGSFPRICDRATAEDKLLARELLGLLETMHPSSDGKQFECFDRICNRVLRIARSFFGRDAAENIRCYDLLKKGHPPVPVNDLLGEVDWRCATLADVFGPFKNDTLKVLAEKQFDVSAPFFEPDVCFDDVVSPDHAAEHVGKQYYPHDPANAGYDWFVIMQSVDGEFFVVATENQFCQLIEVSNPVKAKEDVVEKQAATIKAFMDAGWEERQIIFRLAAHRHVPNFRGKTYSTFHENIIVCGPDELEEGSTPSLQNVFTTLRWIDMMKRCI